MAETFGLTGVNIEEKQQTQAPEKKFVKIDEKTSTMPPISQKTDMRSSEKKEQISSLSKKNNPSNTFLPKKLNPRDQPRSIIRSASSSLHAMEINDRKFDTLKSVLDDLKVTRDLKMDKEKLILQYNQKILDKYEQIYEKSNREVIVKELLNLEKKKYLQSDLEYRENMAQLGKQKFNSLKYETDKKMLQLKSLNKQIDDIQSLFPTTQIIEKFQAKEEELKSLGEKLQQMHFEEQSLEHMQWARRKMLLDVKKQCTLLNDEMQYVNQHKSVHWSHSHIRKNYMKDLLAKYPFLNIAKDTTKKGEFYKPTKDKLGQKFNDNLDDELSEFEETRAIKTILQHEEVLEVERMKELEEERKILEKKKKQERDRLFERATREQRKESEILNKLKNSFREIKLVTNITDINELKEYQGKYENEKDSMEQIKQYLSDKIKEEKKEIEQIKEEIKALKFEKEEESEKQSNDFNYDRLEQNLIQKNNETFENEIHLKKLEKTVDGVGMIVSRILYQLNGKKSRNIEVKRDELLNCVSVAGLKLERMLTILFKKKSNFRIESINTDGSVQQAPTYLGLSNLKVYENESEKENQFEKLFNDPDAMLIKNLSYNYLNKLIHILEDNEVIEEDKYLEQAREKLKQKYDQKQPIQKEKEIEPQKQQDKALFKGLKGINL